MSANKLSTPRKATEDGLAADAAALCAKQIETRSETAPRQAGEPDLIAPALGHEKVKIFLKNRRAVAVFRQRHKMSAVPREKKCRAGRP